MTTTIDDLDLTPGWRHGRPVWILSDGRYIPVVAGGDGDDDLTDDDLTDDERAELDVLSDDERTALDSLSDDEFDSLNALSDEQLAQLRDGSDSTDWRAQAQKWKRLARKHEKRAKDNRSRQQAHGNGGRGNGGSDDDAVEAARREARSEALRQAGERSIELYLDAQVDAGRITGDQADSLLDSIDASKFLDDDGDVDTDKVKRLIESIAKPATGANGSNGKRTVDTGQGRRNGSHRRGERKASVADGRELHERLHGRPKTSSSNAS